MRLAALDVPPNAGKRLFPTVIDDLAKAVPRRILYEYAVGSRVVEGFREVTCWDFANAINRTSWLLDEALGHAPRGEALGYMGPGDIRYLVLAVAAVKTGRKMLFMSPKNSIEGHLAVLESGQCNAWVMTPSDGNIEAVLQHRPMKIVDMLSLEQVLCSDPAEPYEYRKSFEEGRDDPCWILHTSGSTGLPKPVVRYMSSTSNTEAHLLCPQVNGKSLLIDELISSRIYMTFPLIHSAGLSNALLWPIFTGQTLLLGPQAPITSAVIVDMIQHANVDGLMTAPSTVEDLAKDESALQALASIRAVALGGGPLSQETGDIICARTKLILIMGTTEAGWLTCVDTDREDWNYLHFHPNTGLELRLHSSGLYELISVRKPELAKWQAVFTTFPDLQEYSFKDLFSKHPSKSNLWHYEGRADNVIVLSNGEKLNPTSMELAIALHPLVRTALVCGQGKFQIAALIELEDDALSREDDKNKLVETLWPVIQSANVDAPRHAQLSRDHIAFASPDKPFLRAGKGTVQKQLTLALYETELDALWNEDEKDIAGKAPTDILSLASVQAFVGALVRQDTSLPDLRDTDDFFASGADSLQAATMLRHIRSTLGVPVKHINVATIYEHPTIASLADAIWSLTRPEQATENGYADSERIASMHSLIDKYSRPGKVKKVGTMQPCPRVVILTGSTGSLGSYILHELMQRSDIDQIWCLNRSEEAETRQAALSRERGLQNASEKHFVVFRKAALSKAMLGLDEEDYTYLKSHATHIIHNQWQVDFNLALRSFESHIAGVSNLIQFSKEADRPVHISFISSVGVAERWKSSDALVPEAVILDLATAAMGYGESKMVAEHLISRARADGIPSTILRVGQIAGPLSEKGEWNRKEWFPTMIRASQAMNKLPLTLGSQKHVTWIPIDYVARTILDITFGATRNSSETAVHNLVNPNATCWQDLCLETQFVLSQLNQKPVALVSWDQWLDALRQSAEAENLENPGWKLLPFYDSMGRDERGEKRFATCEAEKGSVTLREVGPVQKAWLRFWMGQWGMV